jgi:hypothetical protein
MTRHSMDLIRLVCMAARILAFSRLGTRPNRTAGKQKQNLT